MSSASGGSLAPSWAPYRTLTGKGLRERLAPEYGVPVPSTGNKYPLDPVTICEAPAGLATAGLDNAWPASDSTG